MGPGPAVLDINWLAVLRAAVASFVIGGVWYGPLFGKQWMRASGDDEATLAASGTGRMAVNACYQIVAYAVMGAIPGLWSLA